MLELTFASVVLRLDAVEDATSMIGVVVDFAFADHLEDEVATLTVE